MYLQTDYYSSLLSQVKTSLLQAVLVRPPQLIVYSTNFEQLPDKAGGGRVVRKCCVSYITGASN